SCCGGRVSSRQNAGSSHAQHRLCCLYAVLFYQSWPVCVAASVVDLTFSDQRVPGSEDGDQGRWSLSVSPIALHEGKRGELYHAADGHGPDLWNDFVSVWSAKRNY